MTRVGSQRHSKKKNHTRSYTGPSVLFVVYSLMATGSAAPAVENSVGFPQGPARFLLHTVGLHGI